MQRHLGRTENFKSDRGASRDYSAFSLLFENAHMNKSLLQILHFQKEMCFKCYSIRNSNVLEVVKMWIFRGFPS